MSSERRGTRRRNDDNNAAFDDLVDGEIAAQETQGQTGGQGQIPEFPDDEDDEALFGDAMEFESQHTQNAQSEEPKEGNKDVEKNSEDVSSNREDETQRDNKECHHRGCQVVFRAA